MTTTSTEPAGHWRLGLTVADDLLATANTMAGDASEARWRAAISRAYYAVYNVGRALVGEYRSSSGLAMHPELQRRIKDLYIRAPEIRDTEFEWKGRRLRGSDFCTSVGDTLCRVYKLRLDADYKPAQVTQKQAQAAVTDARRVVHALDALRLARAQQP